MWFAASPDVLPTGVKAGGLKSVPAEVWDQMLDLVHCKVLSVIESDHIDAYLLSESSMFVFPHKLILKTCGTTTLLLGLSRMLSIAAFHAGFPHSKCCATDEVLAIPYRVFYSRKNFLFPDKQTGPHRCWEKEVEFLDGIFESGSAYIVGKMNGDHWYLYLTPPHTKITSKITEDNANGHIKTRSLTSTGSSNSLQDGRANSDETLEILMTDLDQEKARQFYFDHAMTIAASSNLSIACQPQEKSVRQTSNSDAEFLLFGENKNVPLISSQNQEICSFYQKSSSGLLTPPGETCQDEINQGHVLGKVISETSGLSDIYPNSKHLFANVDSHIFWPCGYSANGVIPSVDKKSAHYFTVHVTPEPHCSYASFETNVPSKQSGRDTAAIVERVVNIFKPGRFSMTLFEARSAPDEIDSTCLPREAQADNLQSTKIKKSGINRIVGYRCIDRIVHEFDGYNLVFRHFEREDCPGTT